MTPKSDATAPPQFDEYRLVRPLGSGAMGEVYLCHDTTLDRPVAVKFLRIRDREAHPQASEDFQKEARAIARLSHPNVVSIYRVGAFGGRPYLVSEFVPGQSVDRLQRPMPWRDALRIGIGVARGLCAAHEAGVLHRDIKPANVMRTPTGEIKILDFGLAKLLDLKPESDLAVLSTSPAAPFTSLSETSSHASLSHGTRVVGTPIYMSPEAWAGVYTTRADLYSLGVVLYELCAGRPPHWASTIGVLRDLVTTRDAARLSQAAPSVPRELAAIIDRCLRRDPARRFESAQALCDALERIGTGRRWRWLVPVPLIVMVPILFRPPPMPEREGTIYHGGGAFTMGSKEVDIAAAYGFCQRQPGEACNEAVYAREQPVRAVRVSPFFLDRVEVTNERFAAWLNGQQGIKVEKERHVTSAGVRLLDLYPSYENTQGLHFSEGRFLVWPGFERKPVTHVTWDGALRYCQAQGGSLPAEAQWEFAARGRAGLRFPWGHEEPRCGEVIFARDRDEKGQDQPCAYQGPGAREVGTSPRDRTPAGVMDMGGNVSEWVLDRFSERYPPCDGVCVDPVVSARPKERAVERGVRGGDWAQSAAACRSTGRGRWRQDLSLKNIGFRCAYPERAR